jgi:hypothetical protein
MPSRAEDQVIGQRLQAVSKLGREAPSASNVPAKDPFACRKTPLKAAFLGEFGGSHESEATVAAALRWITDHQMPDGRWCFDHRIGPIINGLPRTSDHPGSGAEARRGATAMAILPFLGAGPTHDFEVAPFLIPTRPCAGGYRFGD